jgi:hypothetical protein
LGPFNNREIATAFWLVLFATWALRKADIRKSLAAVPRAFLRLKIVVPVCLMALYTAAAVMLLAAVGLWNVSLLKDTIVWFCVSGMAMTMRFVTSREAENIFRKVMADSIKIVIVLEFLVNTYTFSLPAELIIMPILTLIAMMDAVASLDKKYSEVAKVTRGAQTLAGFVILAIVVSRAISDLQNLQSLDTLSSIILAPLLCLLFCPCVYVMALLSDYELVFLRLDCGMEKDRRLRQHVRRRILMHAGLSLKKVHHLLRIHSGDLMHVRTKTDVDRLVQTCKDSGK